MGVRSRRWLIPAREEAQPLHATLLHAACRTARLAAGLDKRVSVHSSRHSFATHLLEQGADIRINQPLPGHPRQSARARYTQLSTVTIRATESPPERLRPEVVPPA